MCGICLRYRLPLPSDELDPSYNDLSQLFQTSELAVAARLLPRDMIKGPDLLSAVSIRFYSNKPPPPSATATLAKF